MSEMKPVAWCLMTEDRNIVNGVHEEERIAAQYKYRRYDDTLMPLYTAEQLAEAVAAERERIVTLMDKRIAKFSGDHRRYIRKTESRGMLRDLIHAIRSAAK